MPVLSLCATSCCHLYQAKLLHMRLILFLGEIVAHYPINSTWMRQLCGCRSPPAGLTDGGRQVRTRPEGLAQVLSSGFSRLCSSISPTAAMCRHPWSWPHHCWQQPNVPAHLIYQVLPSTATHCVGEKIANDSLGDPCCICGWWSLSINTVIG